MGDGRMAFSILPHLPTCCQIPPRCRVVDFAGNGAAAGDLLEFVGYGAGATFTQNDATHEPKPH
jgi:hypothetical protein